MDEPLFGERKKQTQISQIIISLIVSLFALFSAAIGVYFGIKYNARHFVLVATVILVFGSLALLVRWWRDQDDRIHPKFKYLIFLLAGCSILASISINCYAWVKPIQCNGLYDIQNKTCANIDGVWGCPCGVYVDVSSNPFIFNCIECPSTSSSENSTSGHKEEEDEYYYYSIYSDTK